MSTNILSNDKPFRTRFENSGVRPIPAFCASLCLLLTFIVPIKWLAVFKCPFLTLTGFPCPFCGLTRSIWAISDGDWIYATINYPLAWLIYAVVAIVFASSISGLIPGIKKTKLYILSPTRNQANRLAGFIISLVLLNWFYRLGLGLT